MTNKLPSNLPQLQNLIKRDPQSYYDEVNLFFLVHDVIYYLVLVTISSLQSIVRAVPFGSLKRIKRN